MGSTSPPSKTQKTPATKKKSSTVARVSPHDDDTDVTSLRTIPSDNTAVEKVVRDADDSDEGAAEADTTNAESSSDPTKNNDLVLEVADHFLEEVSDQLQRIQPSASLSLFLTSRWNFQPHLLTWLLIVFLLGFAPYYAIAGYSPGLLLVIPFGVGLSYALGWLIVYRIHAAAKFREQEENELHVRMMGVATQQWSLVIALLAEVQKRINRNDKPYRESDSASSSSTHSCPLHGVSPSWLGPPIAQKMLSSSSKEDRFDKMNSDMIGKTIEELRSQIDDPSPMFEKQILSGYPRYLSELREIRESLIRRHQHDGHELGPDIPCHSCEIFPVRILRRMAHTPLRGFTGYLLGTTQDAHGARLPAWAPVFIICGFFYIVGFLYVVEFRCAFINWPTCGGLEELNYFNPCGGVDGISLKQYEMDLQIMQTNSSYAPNWPMYEGFPVVYKQEWFSALLSKRAAYGPFYVTIAVCNSQFIFYLVGCLVISTVLAWSTSPSAAELIQQQLKHHIHDLQREEKAAQLKIQMDKASKSKEKGTKSQESEPEVQESAVVEEVKPEELDAKSSPKQSAPASSSKPEPVKSTKNEKKTVSKSPTKDATDECSSSSEDEDDQDGELTSLLAPPQPSKIKDAFDRAKATGSAIRDQSLWQQAWLQLMLSESSNLPGCRDMFMHSDGMDGMRTLVCDREITTFVLEMYARQRRAQIVKSTESKLNVELNGIPSTYQEIEKMDDDSRRRLYSAALTYWMSHDPFIAEYTSLLNMAGQQLKRLRAWGIRWLDDIDEDQFSLRVRRRATIRADMRQERRYEMRMETQMEMDASANPSCLQRIHQRAQGRVRKDLIHLKTEMKQLLSKGLTTQQIETELRTVYCCEQKQSSGLTKQFLSKICSKNGESVMTVYIMSIIRHSLLQKLRGKADQEEQLGDSVPNQSFLNELNLDAESLKVEWPKLLNTVNEIAKRVEKHIWSNVKDKLATMSMQLQLNDCDVLQLLGDLEEEEQILHHIKDSVIKAQVQREIAIKQEAEWVASNEQTALPSIASWNVASLIIALVVGWFQPVWNLTSNASMMHAVDIALNIISVFFNVPMLFLVCRTLRHPFLCYIESHYLMLGLMHPKLDLGDESGNGLKVWKLLRHHLVHHRGRQLNGLAQWSLFISLSVGACLTLMIVLTIVLGGSIKAMFTSYDGLIQVIGAVGLLGFSFGMVKTAVGVWTTQQEHCRMLQEVRFRVSNGRFKEADFKVESASVFNTAAVQQAVKEGIAYGSEKIGQKVGQVSNNPQLAKKATDVIKTNVTKVVDSRTQGSSNSSNESEATSVNMNGMTPGAQQLCKAITDLIEAIREHDVAPAAFGLQMKPTLLQVLYGYVGTAVVAIFSRYVVSSFT